jgi:hypothetical protein
MNSRLEEECQKKEILFFNDFTPFTDENGYLIDEYTDGIHILTEFNPIFKKRFLQFLIDLNVINEKVEPST